LSFKQIRHYIHVLQRTTKWNSQYSTALYQAVISKALGLVADRLVSDPTMRVPVRLAYDAECIEAQD
jgi:hypothetical protein